MVYPVAGDKKPARNMSATSRLPRLIRRTSLANLVVVALLSSTAVYGAVTVTYTTPSTASLSVKPAPVVWQAGPDSSGNSFVSGFALSSNATYFTVAVRPVPEANVTWGNFTTLKNQDTSAYTVTVTGSSVSAYAKILDFRVEFIAYGSSSPTATINFRDASPSASLGSVGAEASFYTKVYLKLDTGTGAGDLPGSVTVSLTLA